VLHSLFNIIGLIHQRRIHAVFSGIIHAGIHAAPRVVRADTRCSAVDHALCERVDVPAEVAVALDEAVLEAVDLGELHAAVHDRPDDVAPARSPDVDGEMIFDDVTEDMYYYDAVKWASENGIVSGYGDGIFAPDDKITRQQLATMLYRYEQYMGGGFAGTWMFRMEYTDLADIAEWAYEPLCWMTMHDVMSGYGNGLLAPNDNATRAQAAQMLMNYLHNRDN